VPFGVFVEAMEHYVVAHRSWRAGLAHKVHTCYPRRTPCFALVTGLAGANHVVPGVSAAEAARSNVVYGQLSGLSATVLAGVVVSKEHLASAHFSLGAGAFYHVDEADDGGDGDGHGGAVEHARVFLEHLRLAPPDEDNCPPRPADIERLVVLIKNQDRGVNHRINPM